MYAMKDTSMSGCADTAYQLVVACVALQALAAVNSEHVGAVAKGVELICKACQAELAIICENMVPYFGMKLGSLRPCGSSN
jgi:hypothetical protein